MGNSGAGKNTRSYVHGTKEAGSLALPWKLAAAAEYARVTGKTAVSTLLDPEKAFEKYRTAS